MTADVIGAICMGALFAPLGAFVAVSSIFEEETLPRWLRAVWATFGGAICLASLSALVWGVLALIGGAL